MRLTELLRALASVVESTRLDGDPEIVSVVNDSRKAAQGSLFVAIKGFKADGAKFVAEAAAKGATVIVHEDDMPTVPPGVSSVKVVDAYLAYALLIERMHGKPAESMRLVGVTGTNGKTTSAFLIESALSRWGCKVGLVSTVHYAYGGKDMPAARTTPEASELQELFSGMRQAGCAYVVMEASSHSLDQHRIGSARFAATLFTNLTGDHLDYHKDMESYFSAKKRLFTEYSTPQTAAVVNVDDPYGKRLASEIAGKVRLATFGKGESCAYKIVSTMPSPGRQTIEILTPACEVHTITTNLIGGYNAYNVAGAFAVCVELGVPAAEAAALLSAPVRVPGRLEGIIAENGASFYVDYAHTDDALRRALFALRELKPMRLLVVFGCGGDRDRTKRPRMGQAAAELHLIVTSDNPRTEEPEAIIKEILAGVPSGVSCEVIVDRAVALRRAVEMAKSGDIVLVAGKGHEDYQEINGKSYPFDDRKVLEAALAAAK